MSLNEIKYSSNEYPSEFSLFDMFLVNLERLLFATYSILSTHGEVGKNVCNICVFLYITNDSLYYSLDA